MSSHSLPAAASRCPVVNGTAFGPLGAAECRDPMPWLRAAQHSAPVFFMPRYDMWCVIRYEDVIEVLRDPVTYSSRKTINLDKLPPDLLSAFPDGPPDRVLVSLDPPGHTRLRGLAQKAFTPKPDWLGFGGTDKLRDFVSGSDRMIRHMSAFLQAMAIEQAGFADASMGATMLLREAARPGCRFPIRRLVVASGGGFVPDNEERRRLLSYDGTPEAMRAILRANFHDPAWAQDDAYVKRRVEASLAPGAREAIAAARLKPPTVPPRSDFGLPDTIAYERIPYPTLAMAGAEDKLRLPGYHEALGRIPDARIVVLAGAGHLLNIEKAGEFNGLVREFLLAGDAGG